MGAQLEAGSNKCNGKRRERVAHDCAARLVRGFAVFHNFLTQNQSWVTIYLSFGSPAI